MQIRKTVKDRKYSSSYTLPISCRQIPLVLPTICQDKSFSMRFSRAMRQNLKRTPSVITWHSQPRHPDLIQKDHENAFCSLKSWSECQQNQDHQDHQDLIPYIYIYLYMYIYYIYIYISYIYIIYRVYIYISYIEYIYIYNHIYLVGLPRFSPHRRTAPAEAWGSEPPKTWSPMRSPSPSHWTWCWRSRWLRDPLQEPREIVLRYTFVRFFKV